jgi:hypothetical protein
LKTDQADIDLIERFLGGQLSQDELMDFETRLEEDHEFARKFRLRKSFPSLFNASGNDLIIQDVKQHQEEEFPLPVAQKENRGSSRTGIILVSFVILLIAAALAWFLFLKHWQKREPAGEKSQVSAPASPHEAVKTSATDTKQTLTSVQTPQNTPVQTPQNTPLQPSQNVPPAAEAGQNIPPATGKPPAGSRTEPLKTSSGIHKPIELLSPQDNMVVTRGENVVFRWTMATDSFTNFYIISEANNKLAWWRGIRPGIRELTVPAINFKTGKFYWYVGGREYRRTLIIME